MGKSHGDNHRARVKRGPVTFNKKKSRRFGRRGYEGGWKILFSCGGEEMIALARNGEIRKVAIAMHTCKKRDCRIMQFGKLNI